MLLQWGTGWHLGLRATTFNATDPSLASHSQHSLRRICCNMGSPLLRDGGDLLQQIGLFLSLEKVENADKFYKTVVGARLLQQLWKKLTREEEIEAYRNEALLAIAEFVKKNPRATEEQILKEVQTQIDAFVQKIQ